MFGVNIQMFCYNYNVYDVNTLNVDEVIPLVMHNLGIL
jgi:hypothetical protein